MLNREQIERAAKKAGIVAYTVLGLDCDYSIVLIDDPDTQEDAVLDITKNEIRINLDKLEPFPQETAELKKSDLSEEERLLDEDYRHYLKICYLVFHEMRHIYQIQAVNVYEIKKMMGGYSGISSLESDRKALLWLEEMKKDCDIPPALRDTEADANDFACYLTNRYPSVMKTVQTNRRLGAMKRKYDKIPIPEV